MKEKIIELINKCITSKDYQLKQFNGNLEENIHYSHKNYTTRFSNDSNTNKLVEKYEKRHVISFPFKDEPRIVIESKSNPSENTESNQTVLIDKSFLGFKYKRKITVKTNNIKWKYVLIYGKVEYELKDYQVNDIIADYKENLNKFRVETYNEQINTRITNLL